jgi:hypothetical protein
MSTVLLVDRSADSFLAGRTRSEVAVLTPFTAQEPRAAAVLPAQV